MRDAAENQYLTHRQIQRNMQGLTPREQKLDTSLKHQQGLARISREAEGIGLIYHIPQPKVRR